MSLVGSTSNQSNISSARDNAGGDINNTNSNNTYINLPDDPSPINAWMAKLADEVRNDAKVTAFIDTLQLYQERHPHDGIDGLEAKLSHVGRAGEVSLALRKKDLFARLLAQYSMFDSAQQIFAYLLSKVETDFRLLVLPNIEGRSQAEIDQMFSTYLVSSCVHEMKPGVFCMNAALVSGMIYWLAEQCYIRWHS